ncbi:hypothetical protein B9Z55_023531 [Caenorhabditis nigoni]|nr:hypothetical protein B9Z55_023531 [Caenorhabditis nigoni]
MRSVSTCSFSDKIIKMEPYKMKLFKYPALVRDKIIQNMDFADVINFSTFKRTRPFLRNVWSQLELNVKLNSDCTEDSILIRKDESIKQQILFHKDSKLSEEDEREHSSKLSAVDLVERIQGPHDDPKEFLMQPMMQTFKFKKKTLTCRRKMDESNDKFFLNIMAMFDNVHVSNFMNRNWTVTPEDIKVFCKRVKDIDFKPCVESNKPENEHDNGFKIKNNLETKKEKKKIAEKEEPAPGTYEAIYQDEYQYGLSFFRQARIPRTRPQSTSSPLETTKVITPDIDNCTDGIKNLQCSESTTESTSNYAQGFCKRSPVKTNWEDSSKIKKDDFGKKEEKTKKEEKSNNTLNIVEEPHNVLPGNYFEPYRDNSQVLYQPHGPSPANYSEEW